MTDTELRNKIYAVSPDISVGDADELMALLHQVEVDSRLDEINKVPFDVDNSTVSWRYFDKRIAELLALSTSKEAGLSAHEATPTALSNEADKPSSGANHG